MGELPKFITGVPSDKIRNQPVLVDFFSTLVQNGTLTGQVAFVTDGEAIVFTVPSNKILYIISLNLAYRTSTATAGADCAISIKEFPIATLRSPNTDGVADSLGLDFTIPPRLEQGDRVTISSGVAGLDISGGFAGYLIDSALDFSKFN